MATFDFTPDYSPVKSKKPEVSTVKFGDGYEQRYPKGINNNPESWSLQFNQREQSEIQAIEDFLDARAGWEAFDWIPPNQVDTIRVKCSQWTRSEEKALRGNITCTFEEVFEP